MVNKPDLPQTSGTTVERFLPQLLSAALAERPVDQLKELMASDPAFGDGSVTQLNRDEWASVAASLSEDQLRAVIELITLAEESLPGWRRGSVSPVIWLFEIYSMRVVESDDLAEWILSHTTNDYLPFGSTNYGARTLAEFEKRRGDSRRMKASRAAAEARRQEGARVRRAERATANIFGAIRRGDIKAVRALLSQGADRRARDDVGRTPFEYAVELDRDQIANLLRGAREE